VKMFYHTLLSIPL
jgi:hypothetical protein